MSHKPEDSNHLHPVPASAIGHDKAEASAHADTAAGGTDEAEPKSIKPSSLPKKFPYKFKGRNDIVRGGSNPSNPNITKTGGSSVNKPQDPKLK